MATSETVLGPNSSLFTFGAGDTPAIIMTALDTYIVSKGWALFDALAPQGQTVGRIYRTLQNGSTTTYKYVGIAVGATGVQLKIWESWNATTHVGTNDGTYVNTSNAVTLGGFSSVAIGTAGAGVVMFVNQKWLAFRAMSSSLVYGVVNGAFEISKDYGESDATFSNIYMTNSIITYPGNTTGGFYGSLRGISNAGVTGATCTSNNNVVTALGMPVFSFAIGTVASSPSTMGAATMTAVETVNGAGSGVKLVRGRIFGIKLIYGPTSWNDMDTAQVVVDSNYHEQPGGTAMSHHIINPGQSSYIRFLLPI